MSMCTLPGLPVEMKQTIALHLNMADLGRYGQINKEFNAIANEEHFYEIFLRTKKIHFVRIPVTKDLTAKMRFNELAKNSSSNNVKTLIFEISKFYMELPTKVRHAKVGHMTILFPHHPEFLLI